MKNLASPVVMAPILALGALILLSSTAFAGPLRDFLSRSKQEVELDIFDKDIDLLGRVEGSLDLVVRPNADKKTFTRSENLTFNAELGPKLSRGPLQVLLRGAQVREIKVFRQYNSVEEAYSARPFSPDDFPIDSMRAARLPVGITIQYVITMGVQVGASLSRRQGISSVRAGFTKVVEGDFFVEVTKVSENLLEVRWLASKNRSRSLSAQFRLRPNLNIFSFEPLEDAANRVIESKNRVGVSSSQGSVFSFEYGLDLNQSAAREAYDQLFSPLQWRQAGATLKSGIRALKTQSSPNELLVSTTEPFEQWASVANSGVTFLSGAKAKFDNFERSLRVRLNTVERERSVSFSQFDFSFQDRDLQEVSFRTAQFLKRRKISVLRGLFERTISISANGILTLTPSEDGEFSVDQFLGLHVSFSRDEALRLKREQRRMRQMFRRLLPRDLLPKTGIENLIGVETQKDARTDFNLVFHKSAFDRASELSVEEILEVYDDFIADLCDDATSLRKNYYGNTWGFKDSSIHRMMNGKRASGDVKHLGTLPWLRSHGSDIDEIRQQLPKIFNPQNSSAERWELFAKLRNYHLFQKIGLGLMNRIVYQADQNQNVSVEDPQYFLSGVALDVELTFRQDSPDLPNSIKASFGEDPALFEFSKISALKEKILNQEYQPPGQ